MDIAQLKYFVMLCEEKNYTKAAEKCFLSRQAMRQTVLSLEKYYGVELIRNEKNHLSVTPAGCILCEKARAVIAAYGDMERGLYAAVETEKPLRIGISRSLIPLFAPDLVHQLDLFAAQYPGIRMKQAVLPSDELIGKLKKGELDCAIVIDCAGPAYDFHRKVLKEHEMTIFMSASHPLAVKKNLTIKDLDREHLQIMSRPEICFFSFLQECRRQEAHPLFEVITDYYEVGYNVLNKGFLAVNRTDDAPRSSTDLDINLPLEGGRWKLCISLLWVTEGRFFCQLFDEIFPLQKN